MEELVKKLLKYFDMESGEWPGIHVDSLLYGKVFGLLSDELYDTLLELQELVDDD